MRLGLKVDGGVVSKSTSDIPSPSHSGVKFKNMWRGSIDMMVSMSVAQFSTRGMDMDGENDRRCVSRPFCLSFIKVSSLFTPNQMARITSVLSSSSRIIERLVYGWTNPDLIL